MTANAVASVASDSSVVGATRYLFGRGLLYTAARALQLVAAVLVTPLITRRLAVEAYGTLATTIRVSQVIAVIVGVGLPAAIARIYFDGGGEARSRRLVVSCALVAVVVTTVFHLTGPWWTLLFQDLSYTGPLVVAVWLAVPVCILEAAQGLLRALDDAAAFVAGSLIASIGGQAVGLAAVVLGQGVTGYLIGVGGATMLAAVVSSLRSGVIGRRPADRRDLREAIALGGPTIPHLLAMLVIFVGDRVVIEQLLGLGAVARYDLTYQVGALGVVLLGAVNNAWAPLIYRSADEDRWDVLAATTSAIYRTVALAIGVLCLGGPLALRALAPSSYDVAGLAPVIAVIAGSAILYARYLANVHVLFQERRTGVLAWSTPVAAAVSILVCIPLVRSIGLVGAALATFVGFAVLTVLTARAVRAVASIPWNRRSDVGAHVGVVAMVVVGAVLPDQPVAWLLTRAVLSAAVAVILVFIAARTWKDMT